MFISDRLFHQQDINSVKRPHLCLNKAKAFEDSCIFPIIDISTPLGNHFTNEIKTKGFNILARDFLLKAEVVHKSSSGHSGVIRAF